MCLALRGVDAKLIIGEEAAHIKPEIYSLLIWPLLRVKNTCVFLISSPSNQYNYVSILMQKRNAETSEYIFHLVSATQSCEVCLRKGISKCGHSMASSPSHLSLATTDPIVEALYDDKDLMNQEILSLPTSYEELSFKHILPDFQELVMGQPHIFRDEVQVIYSFFDPSGGGNSHAAVVSHGVDAGGLKIITGIDKCKRAECNEGWIASDQMLMRHFQMHLEKYPRCCIVWAIEVGANPDLASRVGLETLRRLDEKGYEGRVKVITGQKGYPLRFGVVTTKAEKKNWTQYGVKLFENNQVRLVDDSEMIGSSLDENKVMLFDQMSRWAHRWEETGGTTSEHWKKTRETFDGKAGGKNDDLCASTLACLWQPVILQQNKNGWFPKWCSDHRITIF